MNRMIAPPCSSDNAMAAGDLARSISEVGVGGGDALRKSIMNDTGTTSSDIEGGH